MRSYRPVNVFVLLAGVVNFLGLIFRCCYSFVRENKYTIEKVLLLPAGLRNLVPILETLIVSHGTFGYMTVYSGLSSPLVLQKAMITRKAFWSMDKVPERCAKVVCAPLQLFYLALVKSTFLLIFFQCLML